MKRVYDDVAERYYEALLELQQHCEDKGINFRIVLIDLVERWVDEDKQDQDDPHPGRNRPRR